MGSSDLLNLPISELRTDPVVGRKVFIAEDRARRPNDYSAFSSALDMSPAEGVLAACSFCAGHEEMTPAALAEVADGQGGWQVRVIPNKYPAVNCDATVLPGETGDKNQSDTKIFNAEAPFGAHEVIVESPRHEADLNDLSTSELASVLGVYRDRLRHWASDNRIRHCSLFKNVGFEAGASLEHVHSQLVALPFVPEVIQAELRGAQRHFQTHRKCVFCRLLAEERRLGVRIVAEEDSMIAFCAYAGRQPYEIWIMPTTHAAQFHEIDDQLAMSLARLLQQVLARLREQLSPLSYNLVLHTLPYDGATDQYYHWHWELIPRSSHLAGLEWGAGVHINSLSPERAARFLRDA